MTMVQMIKDVLRTVLIASTALESAQKTLPTAVLLEEMRMNFGTDIPTPGAVTSTQKQALETLGYMSGNDTIKREIDPRDHIHVLSELFQAQDLPHEQAIPALHDLIKQYPNMIHATQR